MSRILVEKIGEGRLSQVLYLKLWIFPDCLNMHFPCYYNHFNKQTLLSIKKALCNNITKKRKKKNESKSIVQKAVVTKLRFAYIETQL